MPVSGETFLPSSMFSTIFCAVSLASSLENTIVNNWIKIIKLFLSFSRRSWTFGTNVHYSGQVLHFCWIRGGGVNRFRKDSPNAMLAHEMHISKSVLPYSHQTKHMQMSFLFIWILQQISNSHSLFNKRVQQSHTRI